MLLAILMSWSGAIAPAQGAAGAAAKIDVEAFVPADALLVVRVRSADDLNRFVRAVNVEQEPPLDFLTGITSDAPFQAHWDTIDRTRPILACVAPVEGPVPVHVILAFHARDAATFADAEELKGMQLSMHVEGDIVALAYGDEPTITAQKSPLIDDLNREDIVLRIDGPAIRKKFGDEIDSGLDALESAAHTNGGDVALTSTIERYRDIVESLLRFEMRLGQHGDETKIAFEALMSKDAPLSSFGKTDKVDLAELARGIDASAPVVYLANMDFSSFQKEWTKSLESAFSTRPGAFQEQTKMLLEALRETTANIGPAACMSFGFDARGASVSACLRPKDAPAFVSGCVAAFGNLPAMVKASPAVHTSVEGVDVTEFHIACDVDATMKAMEPPPKPDANAGSSAGAGTAKPSPHEAMQAKVRALLEKGTNFSVAQKNGTAVLAIGDDDHMKSRLARLAGSRKPLALERALRTIAGMNPCFALQIDPGQFANSARLVADLLGEKETLDAASLEAWKKVPPILVTGGLDDHTWRLEVVGDAKRTIAAFPSSAEKKKPPAEKVRASLVSIQTALDAYAVNNGGKYPDVLEVLVTPDANGQTYLKTRTMPVDPWGRPYLYEAPTPSNPNPRVYTLGRDGKPGGEGDDADIDNFSIRKG